jgi:hypothetical protein
MVLEFQLEQMELAASVSAWAGQKEWNLKLLKKTTLLKERGLMLMLQVIQMEQVLASEPALELLEFELHQ